jgi:PAS domain S-box-containing protein
MLESGARASRAVAAHARRLARPFRSIARFAAALVLLVKRGATAQARTRAETERLKASEAALRESEQRFRAVTENIPGIIYQRLLAPSGAVTLPFVSSGAARILGWSVAEIAAEPQRMMQAIQQEDAAALERAYERSAADLAPWAMDLRVVTRDGKMRWLRGNGVPRLLPSGGIIWNSILIDISEEKVQEQALELSARRLQRSEAHLARAQQIAAIGSWELDCRSAALVWSDETFRIFGVSRTAFKPTLETILERIHEADRARVRGSMLNIAAGSGDPKTLALDFRIVRPDGEVRWVHRDGEVVANEQGAIVGLFGTIQDVSEARETERQRQELELQLIHAQRMDALGTLAGGIAHDLNNTLVPVISLTKLVAKQLDAGSRERASLEIVMQAGDRARALVKQILTFSRKESPEKRIVDTTSFVADSLRMLRASLPSTIQLREVLPAVPRILADPSQLHQVIMNIVTNAAQAIGERSGTIVVELAALGSEEFVRLDIVDDGCGMDDATLRRIFDPFFTTRPVGEGTGLGLAVVHGVVTSHGGTVKVASTPGSGTRFEILLPAIPERFLSQDDIEMRKEVA